MTCTTLAECAEVNTGCCQAATVESIAEDSFWGEEGEAIVVGQQPGECVSAEWQEAVEAMEFPVSALAVLDAWIAQASEEVLAEEGLVAGDDATYYIEAMGGDIYTWENVIISSAACLDDVEEAATALVAASASLLAVALLN